MTIPPFESVLSAHGSDVLRYLVAAVGRQEAEDCFQETFVAALRGYPALTNGHNLRAWVLRIASRKAVDCHRARARRPVAMADPPDGPLDPLPGEDLGLWDAVRALPTKQRAAVTHRFANDLSYAEVAEVVGCSEEAARRNVHEGLKTLRKVWEAG